MEVYFDNAATSFPKPEVVYTAMDRFMREVGASPGRGGHRRALEASRVVSRTRNALARLFNVPEPSRIAFTKNATEALNTIFYGYLNKGDHVVASSMEHNAVWRPLRHLENTGVIELTEVMCNSEGFLEPKEVEKVLRSNTRLIVLSHASNVTGALFPVDEISEIARKHGVALALDAAQTAGVHPIDLVEMKIDLMAFTGHKGLFGPPGTGGLFIREGLQLRPLLHGGTGSNSILEEQPEDLPDRFEAGTANAVGIAGLEAGVDFILKEGVERIRRREMELTGYLLGRLSELAQVTAYGPKDPQKQVGVVSFRVEAGNASPNEIGYILDEVFEIAVRAGLHCAPRAHRTLGTLPDGTVRASLGYFNTEEEIDYLAEALGQIIEKGT
ncbi:MAG: aminotransferase class V-fold PLP-dependent enzyme [Syntrophothermus sp.]